jgi:hypothetical protein
LRIQHDPVFAASCDARRFAALNAAKRGRLDFTGSVKAQLPPFRSPHRLTLLKIEDGEKKPPASAGYRTDEHRFPVIARLDRAIQ